MSRFASYYKFYKTVTEFLCVVWCTRKVTFVFPIFTFNLVDSWLFSYISPYRYNWITCVQKFHSCFLLWYLLEVVNSSKLISHVFSFISMLLLFLQNGVVNSSLLYTLTVHQQTILQSTTIRVFSSKLSLTKYITVLYVYVQLVGRWRNTTHIKSSEILRRIIITKYNKQHYRLKEFTESFEVLLWNIVHSWKHIEWSISFPRLYMLTFLVTSI